MHRSSAALSTSLLAVAVLLLASCSSASDDGDTAGPERSTAAEATETTSPETGSTGAPSTDPASDVTDAQVDGCDPLDPTACLLPFPNDAFTEASETPTGRQLDLPTEGMPTGVEDEPIDPTSINRSDGFSPGSALLVHVPGLDVERSALAPSTDVGASLDDAAPIVVIDAESGERVPHWAELDAQAPSPEDALLMVRPATSFTEGHRYLVGLRGLRDDAGRPVAASAGWEEVTAGTLEPASRLEHLQGVEDDLDEAVGADEDWWLAWDFTVASTDGLSGRLRHMRDAAYDELGEDAPAFTVESAEGDGAVRTVTGTFEVPSFLSSPEPGGTFELDDQGLPQRNATFEANFTCVVPTAPDEPALPVVYGHGLLGSAAEVQALGAAVPLGNLGACATDWVGMSSEDLPNVSQILSDLSRFDEIADRMQQGHVNMSFLGRLLNHDDGFASDPAFQDAAGDPVLDVGATAFVGNSQGGILGAAASSVSTEWRNVVLGVPGINYSLLLTRSVDWDPFSAVFTKAYTDPTEQVLALSLVQTLWDRGENQGYAQHLTDDTYEGIEPKSVLLIEAFGDHQVANVSTEVLARTIGARAHRPALSEGRSPDAEPLWGIEALPEDRAGSALVVWDYGNPAPPPTNEAPRPPEYGDDPHGAGVSEPRVLAQAFAFLRTGVVTDTCDGGPCTSDANG